MPTDALCVVFCLSSSACSSFCSFYLLFCRLSVLSSVLFCNLVLLPNLLRLNQPTCFHIHILHTGAKAQGALLFFLPSGHSVVTAIFDFVRAQYFLPKQNEIAHGVLLSEEACLTLHRRT